MRVAFFSMLSFVVCGCSVPMCLVGFQVLRFVLRRVFVGSSGGIITKMSYFPENIPLRVRTGMTAND